ncbi:MAG: AAA family ATPase [Defluviitaleaceae bacterium]|nr:AAA family ATPase [Defluviitaleaceae bacterium]
MHIANNILKHSLKNVYFLTGTILAGKTTMAKVLVEKHGFVWFDYNHNGKPFKQYKSFCEEKYQPLQIAGDNRYKEHGGYDWDAHFARPAEEIIAESDGRSNNDEFLEFVIIELVKLSQNNKVVIDYCASMDLLVEIANYNKIACLLTAPHLISFDNYGARDDHKDHYEWLMSLNNPEKKKAKQDEIFKIGAENIYNEVRKHNLFNIVRTEKSTIEETLKLLEAHFGLPH